MRGFLKYVLVVVCSLLITLNSFAKTQFKFSSSGNIYLNSESLIFKDNLYYVPTETILFIVNANSIYSNEQKTSTIVWRENEIIFTLDCQYAIYNDKKVEIAGTPFLDKEQFYMPISVIRDVFGGDVYYDKGKDILNVKLNLEDFRMTVNNPFNKINKIDEVDAIEYYTAYGNEDNEIISITDKDEILSILNEYLNNKYIRVEFGVRRTMGYTYHLDLYCQGEKIMRIWVMNEKLISFSDDRGFYELATPLIYKF